MIFVDTSAWFAAIVPDDKNFNTVQEWLESNSDQLITTDYVVDETLTLLKARGEYRYAIELGTQFFGGGLATVTKVESQDFLRAWELFRDYSDKEWSFTDCTSKVVMERLGIHIALAVDHHFTQFGTFTVVPQV